MVEVLLASPGLRHLGLSFVPEAGLDNDFLCEVISDFRSRQQQVEQPTLQLESLHLGIGTMPWTNPHFDIPGYIDDLTDLSHLTSLRLDNMHYLPFYGPVVPYKPIDPALFQHAINLRRISVERFGPDILCLVQLLQEVQSPLRLDALDVLEYGNTLQPDSPEFANEPLHEFHTPEFVGEPIYSVPLDKTGNAWRRLCYSGPVAWDNSKEMLKKSRELLTHFVARCKALEELIIPIHNRDEFDILKTDVLPCLPKIHTLHLPWPDLATFLSDLGTPWHEPYHLHHMSEEEKERLFQKDRELDREQEKSRISLVHELFSYHLHLREDRAGMSPLRYVAIDRDVYARHWTNPSAEGLYRLNDGSSIIRLSRDQAKTAGIVENLRSERVLRLPV